MTPPPPPASQIRHLAEYRPVAGVADAVLKIDFAYPVGPKVQIITVAELLAGKNPTCRTSTARSPKPPESRTPGTNSRSVDPAPAFLRTEPTRLDPGLRDLSPHPRERQRIVTDRSPPMSLICLVCTAAFEATRRDARYCSPRCRARARRARQAAMSEGPRAAAPFSAAVTACLAELPPTMRGHGLALLAQAVAQRADAAGLRDTAALARELRAELAELRALAAAEPPERGDVIDAILARRRLGPPTGDPARW